MVFFCTFHARNFLNLASNPRITFIHLGSSVATHHAVCIDRIYFESQKSLSVFFTVRARREIYIETAHLVESWHLLRLALDYALLHQPPADLSQYQGRRKRMEWPNVFLHGIVLSSLLFSSPPSLSLFLFIILQEEELKWVEDNIPSGEGVRLPTCRLK